MEWLSCFASSFGKDLVCGAVDQLRYPCCFNAFVDDLQGVHSKLITTKDSVKDRLQHDNKQAFRNPPVIPHWLEQDANPLNNTIHHLLNEATTSRSSHCCFGLFPNWIWRYRVAKKLEKKKAEAEKCIEQGCQYIKLERVATLPGTQILPGEKSLEFESRKDAYAELMEALKDDEVTMFGLYGMGGCGKTTMAEQLMRTAEAEHLFDKLLFVPVSSNVQVRIIQDKFASALQYKFQEDGERERAQRLCERLTLEKRILVILDDVWQKLDFGAIGIPIGDNNCKVLITTRSRDVCIQMDCQRKINLATLNDEEAWALFQKQANISDYDTTLKNLGRQISDECKGLPVAIAALAGTLKGKAEVHWEVALERLRTSTLVDIERGLQNPYKCLEVSYDNLDTDEAKSLFLLCSVFPEDYEIDVEALTIYAIGLGLVREVQSFETRRNEVGAAKDKLLSSSLLSLSVDYDGRECVKMHDLIRDVALWKARKDKKEIKCVLEKDVTTFDCSSPIRYMWCEKVVPNDLDCSCLEFLRLETYFEVSDEIFKGMERLRVLYLKKKGRTGSLSAMSLKSLRNLRSLVLYRWKLGDDISPLGYLTKLESCMLYDCSFFELPDVVVTQLTNLKLLYMEGPKIPRRISFQVIGRHPQLEELYYNPEMNYGVEYGDFIKTFSIPQALKRWRLLFGRSQFHYQFKINRERSLILDCLETSNAAVMELAKRTKVLQIGHIVVGGAARNIIPGIFQIECGWVHLSLYRSKEIECLVDTRNHSSGEVVVVFSQLRTLIIQYMEDLETLYRGVPLSGGRLFQQLEKLHIHDCPVMTFLLTSGAARSLVQLQELHISKCKRLRYIIVEENDDDNDWEITRQDDDDKLLVFSKLKSLVIHHCSMLEHVIPLTFAQGLVQLKSVRICGCDNLEYVFRWDNSQNTPIKIELPILENISLDENSNMIGMFPQYCSTICTCPSLKTIKLSSCPKFDIKCFQTISYNQLQDAGDNKKPFYHTLEDLFIDNNEVIQSVFSFSGVDEMKYICVGLKNSFIFQNLIRLHIWGCRKLEVIFPASVVRCLPELESLVIWYCQELKQIIEENNIVSPPQPCFPKLRLLFIENCDNLRHLLSSSSTCNDLPKLRVVVLENLPSLCQAIELPTSTSRIVYNCPKFSLTTSASKKELEDNFSELHKELKRLDIFEWVPTYEFIKLFELSRREVAEVEISNDRHASTSPIDDNDSKLLEGHSNEGTDTTTEGGEVPPSLNPIPSTKLNDQDSTIEPSLVEQRHELEEIISIGENVEEDHTSAGIEGNGLAATVATQTETENSESKMQNEIGVDVHADLDINDGQHILDKVHKIFESDRVVYVPEDAEILNPNEKLSSISDDIFTTQSLGVMSIEGTETTTIGGEVTSSPKSIPSTKMADQESTIEQSLLDNRGLELGETIIIHSIEDKTKESVQEEGSDLVASVETQTEIGTSERKKKMQNEIGGVCKDNNSSHSVIVAELEECKNCVDMDDAHIALLTDAIAVYPHLREVLAKFSVRFRTLMRITLADMLFFLRNESAASVTPQRLEEFQKLCNEAVQLGFDKEWVDEMRERVMVKDHGMEHAETRLNELLKKHDQLNEELCNTKDEIDKLRNLVASHNKCFDFL